MAGRDPNLPDGWIRTPLPPRRRDETPEASWFARTGEPAPPRRTPQREPAGPGQRVAIVIFALGIAFSLAVGAAILVLGT